MNMTKAYPMIVKKMAQVAGNNCVIHHEPTEENPLGQTSLMDIICDILDIVEAAPDPRTQAKDLFTYFTDGKI